jgi:hypothetical protein
VAKLFYKPFDIVLGLIAGALAGRLFRLIWDRVDAENEAPGAHTESASARRAIAATGLQAATTAMTVAALDRAGARTFRHVTGFWPGEAEPAPRQKT